jgi:diacylglycerol kinase
MNLLKSIKSFQFALKGITAAIRNENNLKVQLLLGIVALVLAWWLPLNKAERLWIIFWVTLIPSAEMFNSAIEKLCDKINSNPDEEIGLIKDVSAGAVLWLSIGALSHGLWIFLPYLMKL